MILTCISLTVGREMKKNNKLCKNNERLVRLNGHLIT